MVRERERERKHDHLSTIKINLRQHTCIDLRLSVVLSLSLSDTHSQEFSLYYSLSFFVVSQCV